MLETHRMERKEAHRKKITGVVIDRRGDKAWYLNGELHREDGPAVEWVDGTKTWYLNGKQHRENGPVYELANGDKAWYLNGKYLTEQEWKFSMRKKKIGRLLRC